MTSKGRKQIAEETEGWELTVSVMAKFLAKPAADLMWGRLLDLARRRQLDIDLETELAHHFDALVQIRWSR